VPGCTHVDAVRTRRRTIHAHAATGGYHANFYTHFNNCALSVNHIFASSADRKNLVGLHDRDISMKYQRSLVACHK
jgi:hypothetical protein